MSTAPAAQRFRHEALMYEGLDGFMASVLPFVREGVARREPTLVAVDEHKIALLKGALGPDARSVQFAEMRRLGRNPSCIIPAWRQFVVDNASDAVPMRGVGEPIWPGREGAELDECHRHESLLNVAFDDGPAWTLVCPYDTAALPADVIERARRTHPGPDYEDPYADPLGGELPEPAGQVEEVEFAVQDLGRVRALVAAWAHAAGMREPRVSDLVLAVSELAANSVRHAGGRGRVRAWREPGRLICEVRDTGLIDDPLIGRGLPLEESPSGRGLWLVNQLCDLLQLRAGAAGSVARLHMAL